MRRALMVTALAVALSAPIASASANTTVTVPGLAFPSDDTYLTYFGCDDLYHADTRAPQARIDRGSAPGRHPQLRPPDARHRHRIGPRPRHELDRGHDRRELRGARRVPAAMGSRTSGTSPPSSGRVRSGPVAPT